MCKLASLVGTLIVAVAVVHPATSANVRAQATISHSGSTGSDITDATLTEQGAITRNISTGELRKMLAAGGDMLLLDTRPHLEWSLSHIPGALNVNPKPGLTMAMYTADVAEVERLTGGDKSRRLVLYCNGPFCGKSKRVSEDLLKAGYSNVQRYQLGAPVWRALGGVMVIETDGLAHVAQQDRTAVWLDAREADAFARATVPGARNLPRSGLRPGKDQGEVKAAKDDGRLPMDDHNTRIIVFGQNGAEARAVAEALASEAFHNVTFFEGSVESLRAALGAAAPKAQSR
jgi:rhodanese-related sulfurtransferase